MMLLYPQHTLVSVTYVLHAFVTYMCGGVATGRGAEWGGGPSREGVQSGGGVG